jgi:hypothetical protein
VWDIYSDINSSQKNAGNDVSETLEIKIFLGEHAPRPQDCLHLWNVENFILYVILPPPKFQTLATPLRKLLLNYYLSIFCKPFINIYCKAFIVTV